MQKSSITYILKLSIPIFFANLAIPLVGIIDTSLMGNLGNLSYLTATSIAANLFSMIFWSFGFLFDPKGVLFNIFGRGLLWSNSHRHLLKALREALPAHTRINAKRNLEE